MLVYLNACHTNCLLSSAASHYIKTFIERVVMTYIYVNTI